MKLIYLILVHQFPDQLARLIKKLYTPDVNYIIHLDKKANIEDFNLELNQTNVPPEKIFFAERENCVWGDISLVQATLNCINVLHSKQMKYDYGILISGQDYPLKSNSYLLDFFKYSDNNLYMEVFEEDTCTKRWEKKVFNFRLKNYHFRVDDKWYIHSNDNHIPGGVVSPEVILTCKFPRILPYGLKAWGGSQWWAITSDAINYIVEFLDSHPQYLDFHRKTFIPDEIFFQTILMNKKEFARRIINHRLKFVDWSKDPRPMILDDSYIPEIEEICIENPLLLFGRKFAPKVSGNLLDTIDRCLDKKGF